MVHVSGAEGALHRINRLVQKAQPRFDFRDEIERVVMFFITESGQQLQIGGLL